MGVDLKIRKIGFAKGFPNFGKGFVRPLLHAGLNIIPNSCPSVNRVEGHTFVQHDEIGGINFAKKKAEKAVLGGFQPFLRNQSAEIFGYFPPTRAVANGGTRKKCVCDWILARYLSKKRSILRCKSVAERPRSKRIYNRNIWRNQAKNAQ